MLITEDVRTGSDPCIAREFDATLSIITKQHVFTQRHNRIVRSPEGVAQACNPNTLGGQGGRITEGQKFETSLANMVKPGHYQKYKILAKCGGTHLWSQLLGRLKQENRLNPGVRGCSELRLCHCTPA